MILKLKQKWNIENKSLSIFLFSSFLSLCQLSLFCLIILIIHITYTIYIIILLLSQRNGIVSILTFILLLDITLFIFIILILFLFSFLFPLLPLWWRCQTNTITNSPNSQPTRDRDIHLIKHSSVINFFSIDYFSHPTRKTATPKICPYNNPINE